MEERGGKGKGVEGKEGKGRRGVATLRPAAVSRACEYVGSKATSSTNVLYDVSPSSSRSIFLN